MSTCIETMTRSQALRLELKQWEQDFAAANGGRKATREEIKRDGDIAAKYKEYNKLRDPISKTSSPAKVKARKPHHIQLYQDQASDHIHDNGRRSPRKNIAMSSTTTPQKKRPNTHETPSKYVGYTPSRSQDEDVNDENRIPAPAFIDPTPQKDGRVLGLFDLLSPIAPRIYTPSKSRSRSILGDIVNGQNGNAERRQSPRTSRMTTEPSSSRKRMLEENATEGVTSVIGRHSNTPQSSRKRQMLESFLTPSKRRRLDTEATPSSRPKAALITQALPGPNEIATPAFLRRSTLDMSTLPILQEDEETTDTNKNDRSALTASTTDNVSTKSTWLRRRSGPSIFGRTRVPSMTRSLSSMITDMKKAEDDHLDEELELLRELENEEYNPLPHKTWKLNAETRTATNEAVLVEDSQHADAGDLTLLGPDGTGEVSDGDERVQLGRDGKPLRVWKKKGMKRQTRRVIMRPTGRPKPAVQPTLADEDDSDIEEAATASEAIVAETQLRDDLIDEDGNEDGSDFDHVCNDDLSDDDLPITRKKPATTSKKSTTAKEDVPAPKTDPKKTKGEGVIKKAARKISATAHANFRKLKIKSSKGAKGGGGGRFGGRRFGRR